ncbi:hypothetical protein ES707_01428 [subsurface metagenome]
MLIIVGRDAIADFAQTAYAAGVPDFEEADILLVTHVSGLTGAPPPETVDYTVDPYNATDWADGAKPAVEHAMFNAGARQFKIASTVPPDDGSLLLVVMRPKGARVKVS